MTNEELFEELKALAVELGIRVRFENGNFDGGYCLLREERMLVLNRKANVIKKIKTLSLGLNEYGIEGVFVPPALREAIDDELAKAANEGSPIRQATAAESLAEALPSKALHTEATPA